MKRADRASVNLAMFHEVTRDEYRIESLGLLDRTVHVRYPAFASVSVLKEGDVVRTVNGSVGPITSVHAVQCRATMMDLWSGFKRELRSWEIVTKRHMQNFDWLDTMEPKALEALPTRSKWTPREAF